MSTWRDASRRWQRRYAAVSLPVIAVFPVLPEAGRGLAVVVACGGAAACVAVGRHRVERGQRKAWTLLLCALAVYVISNAVLLAPDERIASLGLLVDAFGNLLALAAALSLIIRRGARDLGGIVDAAVIAFAAGSVLWAVLPRRLGTDTGFAAQIDLFVVVFALTGVLGALLRLARTAGEPTSALWWLLAAISLAIGGNVTESIGDGTPEADTVAGAMFVGVFTAIGLFGLDPAGPRVMYPQAAVGGERLSASRLVFLGAAVAVVPAVLGARIVMAGDPTGILLTVQGALVAALVMVRIGILARQRANAEQALVHQATHDPLTQLPNRRQFVSRLGDELARGTRCTVLFCDLDQFKLINDYYGHDAGDRLLVDVAQALRACVGTPHMVSRFGGDEFVVLLIGATPDQANAVRDCVVTTLGRPFEPVAGHKVAMSIGIAHADGQRDPEKLIKAADHAMYEVKTERTSRAPNERRDGEPGTGA